jgi:colanic acid/amylovoran biosynthesis protein
VIIESTGTGYHNKGAELMLLATRDEVARWQPRHSVVLDAWLVSRRRARRDGIGRLLRTTPDRLGSVGRAAASLADRTPSALMGGVGLVRPSDVAAVLDASGFLFSDQWGPGVIRRMGAVYGSYRRTGRPVVLLPQAFGPFRSTEVAAAARDALDAADLIFARDPDSLDHLHALGLQRPTLRMAPDFTIDVSPTPADLPEGTVVIIPNARMVDKVHGARVDGYVQHLAACAAAALDMGRPVIVGAHDKGDGPIADAVAATTGGRARVIRFRDALEAKRHAGGAQAVISSRYHGIVNALSQGVPAVGTSWSHKYRHLFDEYGCADALWEFSEPATTYGLATDWLEPGNLATGAAALAGPVDRIRRATWEMWRAASAAIGTSIGEVDRLPIDG